VICNAQTPTCEPAQAFRQRLTARVRMLEGLESHRSVPQLVNPGQIAAIMMV
jgi:hypothetical protein